MLAGTRKTPRLFYAFLVMMGRSGPAFNYVPVRAGLGPPPRLRAGFGLASPAAPSPLVALPSPGVPPQL